MKRIPRDLSAQKLIKLLSKQYNYVVTRQTGSHIRLSTGIKGEHHITIPNHDPIKIGTLSSILSALAEHHQISKEQLVDSLF